MEPIAALEHAHNRKLPLAVDLDGTFLVVDSLHESLLRSVRRHWWAVFALPFWLLRGKVHLKSRLAQLGGIDPATTPVNGPLLAYVEAERQGGRTIVLATAAHRVIAESIATAYGVFDRVFASEGEVNLKGEHKAAALVAAFGEQGFAYAGNDRSDVAVWRRAGAAVVVGAPAVVRRSIPEHVRVEAEFAATTPARGLLRAMRPYQWVKNVLVFVAPLMAHDLSHPSAVAAVVAIFVAYCLAASGVYLVNDALDVEADRRHPRKRSRPFASGALPVRYAMLGPVLMALGMVLASGSGLGSGLLLAGYCAVSIAYSSVLKTLPLVDVFVLAGLYSVRLFAGAVAVDVAVSIWLLSFSGFLFLGLAFLKRYSECVALDADVSYGRGYGQSDSAVLQSMGVAAGFTASLVLALYVNSPEARAMYPGHLWLWALVPLLLLWQCRLWLAAHRGFMTDDPIVYATRDRISWAVGILAALLFAAASALPVEMRF